MTTAPTRALLEFKPSPIHGTGGFALEPIRAGTLVIEYVGEKIPKCESSRRCEAGNTFVFELDEQWDIDGGSDGNPARLLNHSCAPNCDAELIDGQIWIVARHDIDAGEEITFNYGYDWEDFREHPCHCGTPDCVGYIVAEEFFPALRERMQLDLKP